MQTNFGAFFFGIFRYNGTMKRCGSDTTPFITHRYALKNIEEAYHIFENKPDGVIKIAITPN